jgi:hypothetical protein
VKTALTIFCFLLATVPSTLASLVITYDAAGVQNTTVSGANVYTFDNLANGLNTGVTWSGVGSFDSVWAQSADQYGGAGGTGKYAVTGAEASSASLLATTLTLNSPESYLGFWLSAGDSENLVTLYQGTTELAAVNVSTVLSAVGACSGSNPYCGNPNTGQDSGEPFVYINFYGTSGTTISKVVFSNANYGTGFEFDNVAVESAQVPTSGLPVTTLSSTPEPGTTLLFAGGLGVVAWLLRRRGVAA